MNKLLLDYLDHKENLKKPLWLMRQAGRYLPEYREVRRNFKNFLEFCYTPEAACLVTLQPIERFDFDAAIIFSDILVIPDALGQHIEFTEGPVLKPLTLKELATFNFQKIEGRIEKVYEAITLTKSKLSKEKTLIGFAGAPWTLACYMLGKSADDFKDVKLHAFLESPILDELIMGLTESVFLHLKNQILAGAEIVQIFDSWAGILTEDLYKKYIINPTKLIITKIKSTFPNLKIIGFPRGSSTRYIDYLTTGIDVLGIDQNIDLNWAIKNLSDKVILQGNIDPLLLLIQDENKLKNRIINYLKAIENNRFICNLGHGVLKETPVRNVSILSDLIKNYKI